MSMWSEPSWLFLVDPMSGSVTEGSGTGDRWLLLLWWWLIREPRLAAEMFLGKGELCSFSSLGWLREGEKGSQRVRDTRRDCEGSCVDLHMDRWRYGKWCRIKTNRLYENKPMQTDQNSYTPFLRYGSLYKDPSSTCAWGEEHGEHWLGPQLWSGLRWSSSPPPDGQYQEESSGPNPKAQLLMREAKHEAM